MFPRSASALSIQPTVTIFQEHLAELSAIVVALVLCSSVLVAAVFLLILKPSPRHHLILDLWTWAEQEDTQSQSASRLAA